MRRIDYSDVIGSLLIISMGLFMGIYAWSRYDLGQFNRMGPGMFPVLLSSLLVLLGVVTLIPALRREGQMPRIDGRSTLAIVAATSLFALTVTRLGMVPAVILMTIVATFADTKVRLTGALVLSVALSFVAWLVFKAGIGIVLPAFRWPF